MAKKKPSTPRSFTGMIRGRDRRIQAIAKSARDLVFEELPEAAESFHSGRDPLAIYRTEGEVCWIQPFTKHCNVYFVRGTELTDPEGQLKGTSDRFRFVQLRSLKDLETFPIREWIRETVELNEETIAGGVSYEEVLERLREVSQRFPETKETLTWGRPHFRVKEKIFCGCGEANGRVSIGLKLERRESELMMKLPGIEKAPYSRKGDGWIAIDPGVFDDWDEIERFLLESYRLVAPKKLAAQLDES